MWLRGWEAEKVLTTFHLASHLCSPFEAFEFQKLIVRRSQAQTCFYPPWYPKNASLEQKMTILVFQWAPPLLTLCESLPKYQINKQSLLDDRRAKS